MAVIPHKYCYTVVSQREAPGETILYLEKSTFFRDCTAETRTLIDTDKDVVIYIDGQRDAYYTNAEICERQ